MCVVCFNEFLDLTVDYGIFLNFFNFFFNGWILSRDILISSLSQDFVQPMYKFAIIMGNLLFLLKGFLIVHRY